MISRQIQPPDHLRQYVRYFWTLEKNDTQPSPTTFEPVADGCPGLIFQASGPLSIYGKRLSPVILYGQTIKPIELHTTGSFAIVAISFYPTALKALFGLNAEDLTDTCTDIKLLSSTQGSSLEERLLNADDTDDRINILSFHLSMLAKKSKEKDDAITQYVLSEIISKKGNIMLRELQKDIFLSERSFERRFKQYVGVSPKLYARICRFQSALDQLKKSQYTRLSDIAFENGYADQSHFIRSFKEFTGYSPYQYQKRSMGRIFGIPEMAN